MDWLFLPVNDKLNVWNPQFLVQFPSDAQRAKYASLNYSFGIWMPQSKKLTIKSIESAFEKGIFIRNFIQ